MWFVMKERGVQWEIRQTATTGTQGTTGTHPQGRAESRHGLLPQAECMTIGDHVPIVLFEAAGEAVVAVAIADKIKKLRALGMQSRFQGAFSRIADWPRRPSRATIRVIGRVH